MGVRIFALVLPRQQKCLWQIAFNVAVLVEMCPVASSYVKDQSTALRATVDSTLGTTFQTPDAAYRDVILKVNLSLKTNGVRFSVFFFFTVNTYFVQLQCSSQKNMFDTTERSSCQKMSDTQYYCHYRCNCNSILKICPSTDKKKGNLSPVVQPPRLFGPGWSVCPFFFLVLVLVL